MSRSVYRLALVVVLISVARPAQAQAAATRHLHTEVSTNSGLSHLKTAGASNQSTKGLEITSPADGAVVNPGQTLIVTVTSPDHSTFRKVLVIAEGAIGM